LALSATLLVYLAWRTGITVDEPAHIISARLYWQGADRLRPGDMPPMIKILGGWVPSRMKLPLPPNLGEDGENRHEWNVAIDMLQAMKWADIQPLIFYSRLPLLIFPLLNILLIWWWARELFTPTIGLIAAALFAFEPTALAHGAVFKNDHAATFGYVLLFYLMWRYWRVATWKNAILIGLAIAVCLLSKLTLLFVAALAPLLMLRAGKRFLLHAGAALLIAYALLACAVQFEMYRLAPEDLQRLAQNRALPAYFSAISHLFRVVPVPDRMWHGVVTLWGDTAVEQPVYMFGKIHPQGHLLYFLVCLLVKSPVALLALALIAVPMLLIALSRRRLEWRDALWLVPAPLYIALASRVPYQQGVRLVLPALPFGILIACFAIQRLQGWRTGKALIAILLALFAFEAGRIYPFGMSFFNVAAGGPGAGIEYLADSNLDWGQGLGEVKRWADAHHALPINLSYFGVDMMYRHFAGAEVKPIAPPWNDALAKDKTELIPEPGKYYAISPTLLPGQFFAPKYRDFYRVFRGLKPIARPGYSMFVYRVDTLAR
jgi:hypothetical protein